MCLCAGFGVPVAASQTVPATSAAQPASADAGAQAAKGAEPGQPTAPKPVTAMRLAELPKPLPPQLTKDINVNGRSKEILAHLSEVIRYYRMSIVTIQKTGEPSDMLYAEQAQVEATQAAQLAFQSARDEATLLSRVEGGQPGAAPNPQAEASKLNSSVHTVAVRLTQLQAQDQALDEQIAKAPARARAALQLQKQDIEGQLELAKASYEALNKVAGISSTQSDTGLQGQINQLQSAVPELINNKVKPVASTIESIASLHDAGVSSQAVVLFQLLGTERAIDQQIAETQLLRDQSVDLRTPLVNILRATLAAGQNMQVNAPAVLAPGSASPATASPESVIAARKQMFDQLTDAFRAISDVAIPISQEVLLFEQARANLLSWRAAVDSERSTILHALLLRVISIAVALGIILGIGEAWRRLTTRYIQDVRRRRQLMLVRRMVIGFFSGLVLIFGFVTQFSSLATFAGFITAGIAVGLQTILLSVAAYFFIVGRYGVRVGDRITVANVTGDVVEVGLVRFYMMELTGTGTELHPTGRIAVFANSVLFQTGTPLYKQIPGTEYAWHELTLKLKPGTNYLPATETIRSAVESIYSGYKSAIEDQHRQVESWMDTALEAPHVESRLQLTDSLQFAVLYPVLIRKAAETDQQIVQKVLETVREPAIAEVLDGEPVVKAVVKG